VNFFWENSRIGFKVLGEYLFAYGPEITTSTGWTDTTTILTEWAEWGQHRAGLGVISTKPQFGKWKPGIRWYHDFVEGSGQVVLGLTGPVAPMISANIAVPIVYGPDYGYFWQNNEDDPGNRVLGLIVQLSISSSF